MFQARGHYAPTSFQPQALRSAVLICSAVATLVEGASLPDVDNVLTPLAVLLSPRLHYRLLTLCPAAY